MSTVLSSGLRGPQVANPAREAARLLGPVALGAAIAGAACLLPAGAASAAGHQLPLRRGVYVEASMPCRDAPMSTRSWYSGAGYVIQAPHARCRATSVSRRGRTAFTIRELCRDDSMPQAAYRVTNRIKVFDRERYEMSNQFGRFRARWCRG